MNKPRDTKLKTIIKLLGISARQIQKLEKDGILPRRKPEEDYNVVDCVQAYITHWRKKALSKGTGGEAKKEREKWQALREKLHYEEEKGMYIHRATVADELVKRTYTIKHDQLALERRLNRYPEAKEIVKKSHRAMWQNYSRKTGVFKDAK